MAYRSDDDAEAERLRALSAQMAEVELRLAQRNMLRAHRERVEAQLKSATSAAAKKRAKVPLPLLARIRVASPCSERWDLMTGDERVRHCAACDKDVYDLSEMTAAEAEDLLANVGEAACVRLHRRADGTVITSDCPVGVKRKRRRRVLATGAGMALSAMAATATLLGMEGAPKGPPPCAISRPGLMTGAIAVMPEPTQPEPEALGSYAMPPPPVSGGIRMMPLPRDEHAHDADRHPPRRHRRRARTP
jgi:hypothetical protein